MKRIRVGAGILNQIPLAWDHNRDTILGAIEEARREDVSVLLLPELCITGYDCEDAFYGIDTPDRAWRMLRDEIVPATEGLVVSVGLPLQFHHALFNTACLIVDGAVRGFVAKQNLAASGLYYEPRWFRPWPAGRRVTIERDGRTYPLGDFTFDCGGIEIGYEICEDAWVANRTGGAVSKRGVDIILNPSGSHFAFGKHEVRRRLVLEGSRAFGVTYLYANMIGCEAGRAIYDGGAIIASSGDIIAQGPRFTYRDYHVTAATIDIERSRTVRTRTGSYQPSFEFDETHSVDVDFTPPDSTDYSRGPSGAPGDWEDSDRRKEEEFSRAVALGLFDYMRKSWTRGFVISLSGGADSAACAVLVALMVELGIADLGREDFLRKLSYIDVIQDLERREDMVSELLTCAYQATRNSSETTREAARAVAEAIGADFLMLDVDEIVQDYIGLIEGAIERDLTWSSDDITLQNIQARARAPSIWMLANIRSALLLATSNRSEAAVGYTTMDGDTCGGLSPIAGIDKHFLRKWLRWMEDEAPRGVEPIGALEKVNVQQPTAELRPKDADQTDEGDLMPYELLDAIEEAAIRDKKPPRECFEILRADYPQYDRDQLLVWVERFFHLWSRNQWKRERYAPSFHLDDKNLDPKTWMRFPILSGGFRRELAELRDYVAGLSDDDDSERSTEAP